MTLFVWRIKPAHENVDCFLQFVPLSIPNFCCCPWMNPQIQTYFRGHLDILTSLCFILLKYKKIQATQLTYFFCRFGLVILLKSKFHFRGTVVYSGIPQQNPPHHSWHGVWAWDQCIGIILYWCTQNRILHYPIEMFNVSRHAMVDNSKVKEKEFVKGANENSVDVLIRRFKAGDPEVMYEKIQVCLG